MISIELDRGGFNYRVAAVVCDDGHLLIVKETNGDLWFLPGGRCEFMESSPDALRRELREELGADCQVDRLLWIVENFFSMGKRIVHEIGFYFLVSLPPASPLRHKSAHFAFTDGGFDLEARWFPLGEVVEINLVPAFLRTELSDLPTTTRHIIWNELGSG